ncbi:hypothetical protein LTR24_005680 [Lithohypha guttulata]|uniref:Uncharacterized protein n=1 Tax=Lithohypha guttulata TaxID=1690604 RepID=A0ABR0K8H4_9EURO|nr:hypothetical protein LTR24_005680 [Lithohypha guttulata]
MALEDTMQSYNTSTAGDDNLGNHSIASGPARPTSSDTLDSAFADSAVDMDPTTPAELLESTTKMDAQYFEPTLPLTTGEVDQTLSNKMRQLAAVAWEMEQDNSMTPSRRQSLHKRLQDLEAYLESDTTGEVELALAEDEVEIVEHGQDKKEHPAMDTLPDEEDDEWIDESDLIAVREDLAATKLEAVAQRCIAQEQQAQDLLREVRELRLKSHTLGAENDRLREQAANLEVDASRNEVAVEAMSSAVTGLEGWIESTHSSRVQTPILSKSARRQKVVTRGKGRFRGHYYVDENGDEAVAYSLSDAPTESQELHEGVKAWLRGFRDVEEELRQLESPGPSARSRPQGRFKVFDRCEEDGWVGFQSPSVRDRN